MASEKDALPEASRHQKAKSRIARHRVIQRHPPAINKHNFSGGVACSFARQKGHVVGDLRQLPDLLHRRAAHDFGFRFILVSTALAASSIAIVPGATALTALMLMMLPRKAEPLMPVRASALS